MKKNNISDIQLIFTAALKKELPADWLKSHHIPVHTLSGLKSGALYRQTGSPPGILIVITGAGLKASEEAACWIRDNLRPLYVVNIGTCGLTRTKHPLGRWFSPLNVYNETGEQVAIDTRMPVAAPLDTETIDSLLSVTKAASGNLPAEWKKHDAIDMECFAQAGVFREAGINFHCLKFSSDYSDRNTIADFNRNLELLRHNFKVTFKFLSRTAPHSEKAGPSGDRVHITVIIPVYNRENIVRGAVNSVIAQTYPPEKIIVVDDCSSDNTRERLEGYGRKITLLTLPRNSGPSRARNEGIGHAKTAWIAFLDSDDCWKKDKLAKEVAYLRKYPFYQIIQSEEIWIRSGKRVNPRKHHKKPAGWIWEPSLERCLVSPSGVLIKKSLIEQYGGFNEDLPVCEDYDLWLRISRHHPVGLVPDLTVVKYGGHPDQLSRKYPAMDRYRVQSLARLLQREKDPCFRQKLRDVLRKKSDILIQGYEKRGNDEGARDIKALLKSLRRYDPH